MTSQEIKIEDLNQVAPTTSLEPDYFLPDNSDSAPERNSDSEDIQQEPKDQPAISETRVHQSAEIENQDYFPMDNNLENKFAVAENFPLQRIQQESKNERPIPEQANPTPSQLREPFCDILARVNSKLNLPKSEYSPIKTPEDERREQIVRTKVGKEFNPLLMLLSNDLRQNDVEDFKWVRTNEKDQEAELVTTEKGKFDLRYADPVTGEKRFGSADYENGEVPESYWQAMAEVKASGRAVWEEGQTTVVYARRQADGKVESAIYDMESKIQDQEPKEEKDIDEVQPFSEEIEYNVPKFSAAENELSERISESVNNWEQGFRAHSEQGLSQPTKVEPIHDQIFASNKVPEVTDSQSLNNSQTGFEKNDSDLVRASLSPSAEHQASAFQVLNAVTAKESGISLDHEGLNNLVHRSLNLTKTDAPHSQNNSEIAAKTSNIHETPNSHEIKDLSVNEKKDETGGPLEQILHSTFVKSPFLQQEQLTSAAIRENKQTADIESNLPERSSQPTQDLQNQKKEFRSFRNETTEQPITSRLNLESETGITITGLENLRQKDDRGTITFNARGLSQHLSNESASELNTALLIEQVPQQKPPEETEQTLNIPIKPEITGLVTINSDSNPKLITQQPETESLDPSLRSFTTKPQDASLVYRPENIGLKENTPPIELKLTRIEMRAAEILKQSERKSTNPNTGSINNSKFTYFEESLKPRVENSQHETVRTEQLRTSNRIVQTLKPSGPGYKGVQAAITELRRTASALNELRSLSAYNPNPGPEPEDELSTPFPSAISSSFEAIRLSA